METVKIRAISIDTPAGTVSGLVIAPHAAIACYVMAHGAGAGMEHPFMTAVAEGLSVRGIATLRYQFPSMEKGNKRPDRPAIAHAAVRAAVDAASRELPELPLFAGGKSFGGRMTSQAQAISPLAGVRGLVFFGFPLHPPKRPSTERGLHLADIQIPMLFIQGSRDALAEMSQLKRLHKTLGLWAAVALVEGGDHGFHVPVRSGRTDAQALDTSLDTMRDWVKTARVDTCQSPIIRANM